jgi:2-C-methyl-D-erythritol 4-phosphate cytidylyltransferase
MRYWLIMPAAGASRRFKGAVPKQYAPLNGKTVIEWALAPFIADTRCAGIVIALAREDTQWAKIASRLCVVRVAAGGAERSQSVRNALALLRRDAGPDDWILVHDAARPCLKAADRDRLLERAGAHPCGGLLVTLLTDTLKRQAGGDAEPTVECTLDRAGLWRAQTPQMFRYAKLCDALDQALSAGKFPTDESQALEWLGEHPLLVEGSAANIKITSAHDLKLAEGLL